MFTLVVFTDGRNDYLEQTLTTFVEQVSFPEPPYKILIDDMPQERDADQLGKIAARFAFDELILNDTNLGVFGTVLKAWSCLPANTEYVFDLQNDFVFHRPLEVRDLMSVLQEPTICNITLLRQPWYEDEREDGGLLLTRPERFQEAVVNDIPVCLHQSYFGHNPGMYRREFARIIPDTSRSEPGRVLSHEFVYRDVLIAEDPSRQFAILGHRHDPPRVVHIGYRRVGFSPSHREEAPPSDGSAERQEAARSDQLEHDVLVRRVAALEHELEHIQWPAIQRRRDDLGIAEQAVAAQRALLSRIAGGSVAFANSKPLDDWAALAFSPSPGGQPDLGTLRQRMQHRLAEHRILDRRLDLLDSEVSNLCHAAVELGSPAVLPQRKSLKANAGSILLYHRIASLECDPARLCIPPDVFRHHMEHVARTCEPMSLDALRMASAERQIPRRAVAITLDDGYTDNFAASEILRSLHLPATFFVNSSAGGETFLDSLAQVFLSDVNLPPEFEISAMGSQLRMSTAGNVARRSAFDTLRDLGWSLADEGRRQLLAGVARWSGIDVAPRSNYRMMTPGELRELASRPLHEIGAHTHDHLFLPAQQRLIKLHQLEANRDYLEAVLGKRPSSFAYPYGAYDDEVVAICRRLGFQTAVTVERRSVRAWDDPLQLPRKEINTHGIDDLELALQLL